MTKFTSVLFTFFVISLLANGWLLIYWHNAEYPSGYDYKDVTTIEFLPYKSYADNYYVSFNNGYYYILGNGVKEKIENELEHWNNIFNTTNFLVEKPQHENVSYTFRIYYHTIDEYMECSMDTYKKKVCDNFELSSWGWHE